jgi:hypothetical protein
MKFLILLLLLFSCSRDEFKKYTKLKGLRVIAIVADTPQINETNFTPNATINLTPWISYPKGNGEEVNIKGTVCLDPGVGLGAKPVCDNPDFILDEFDVDYDTGLLTEDNFYTGAMTTSIPITISASQKLLIDNNTTTNQRKNGVNFIVTMTVKAGKNKINTFRRISYTSRSEVNTNPSFDDIVTSSGAELSTLPKGDKKLKLKNISDEESFIFINSNGEDISITEQFLTTWFVYRGDVFPSRTTTKTKLNYDPPSSGKDIIVAVLRDGRGGVAARLIRLD